MRRAPSTFALVLALLAAALLLGLALAGGLQRRFGRQVVGESFGRLAVATATAVDALADRPSDPAARQTLATLRGMGVELHAGPPPPAPRRVPPALAAIERGVGRLLGDPAVVTTRQDAASHVWVRSARDPDRWVVLQLPSYRQRVVDSTLVLSALAGLIALVAAGLSARLLTRPLERLARQAPALLDGTCADTALAGSTREVRRLAQAIGDAGGRLRAAARERELMLASISHDLRTPLARLRLALELGDAADPLRRNAMVTDLEELDRALEQCLAFVREGRDEPLQPLELATLAGQLLALRADPEDWQLDAPDELVATARPLLLRRALGNLMDNAERYGRAPFSLTLAREGGEVVLAVADRGPGVAPSLLDRLGQPFLRGDPARSGGGSGLGLSIAARAARVHGGSLVLANRPGGGFVATLRLPAG